MTAGESERIISRTGGGSPRPWHFQPRLWALALILILACPAPGAGEQPSPSPARTAVILEPTPLTSPDGAILGAAAPGEALELAGQEGSRLRVRLGDGQPAWLEAAAAAIMRGAPPEQASRLARLAAAHLSPSLRRRLLSGLIAPGDSPWEVELAWGRPWRSYMVNLFRDEEHYVYRDQAGGPILLRFKGGRLEPPLPRQALAVESSFAPR
jgi:hypothetical protein